MKFRIYCFSNTIQIMTAAAAKAGSYFSRAKCKHMFLTKRNVFGSFSSTIMPRHKNIPTLYYQSVKILYNIIFDYCSHLDWNEVPDKGRRLKLLHEYLVKQFPTSVLDDLLQIHYSNGNDNNNRSLQSYYFYRAVVHSRLQCFKARNYKLDLSYWRSLFKTSFSNLVTLNLALSCNDQILELIPCYCPNLEHLNATCKYERVEIGANACTFALSVTDYGLGFLCNCKKLRTITVNEPRSNSRCIQNGITYAGLRRLLQRVHTLEDVSYSDLGSVVRKGLETLESLNLKIIRHFNATEESIREILRLCTNLQELYLTFFNSEAQNALWLEIMKADINLKALEVINLNCRTHFNDLFRSIGQSLVFLSISNNFFTISFSNIVTIGRFCPNLTYLACSQVVNRNEVVCRPKNLEQFSKLENLHIHGNDIDIENVLIFCTEHAKNLENIRIIEKGTHDTNMDRIFVSSVPSEKLRHIETSIKLPFTTCGIRRLLATYPVLNYLNVSCVDDFMEFLHEIKDNNYDLVFINKVLIPFQLT